jgi:hypothetical protein
MLAIECEARIDPLPAKRRAESFILFVRLVAPSSGMEQHKVQNQIY